MPLVTDNMLYNAASQNVLLTQARVQTAQQHTASGLRVLSAADDPVAAAQGSLYAASLGQLGGMQSAATFAHSRLGVSDQVLRQTSVLLAQAKELAVQGSTATLSAEDRGALAGQAQALHDALLTLANTQSEGDYIFAGFATATAPFAADGTYAGDAGVRQVETAPGALVATNVPGNQVFNVAGGQNILGMLQSLQSALAGNDVAGVQDAVGNVDVALQQVVGAQAQLASSMTELQVADTSRDSTRLLVQNALASTVQADLAQSFTDMLQAQAAYQAAVAEATRILTGLDTQL